MNKLKEAIRVKCKSYYWGFCKETEADKDGNRDFCKQENCKKFKTEKILK